ncbi:5932_t:CDS:2, partial [Funneliformis geosporum]
HYNNTSKDSDWVANVLCEWNKSAITVQIPANAHSLIKGGNTPIHTVILECYKEFAAALKKYFLLFLKQLSYSHGQSMFTFVNLAELLSNPTDELRQKVLHSKECYSDFITPNKIP